MIRIVITPDPIATPPADDSRTGEGSELIFHGRVRDEEHGRPIVALEYEHYAGMAEAELEKLARETVEGFRLADLICTHRVGRIGVGESSLQVIVWSKHRAEGLRAMGHFIRQLKLRVPIWKWAVTPDGERFPSHCNHEHDED